MYQSIPSLTIPPSRANPGDSHILVAPGVGFRSSVFPGDFPGGGGFQIKVKVR